MRKYLLSLPILFALVFLTACGGTLSIALEVTPTPDAAAGATVATLEARIATLQPQRPALDMNSDSETIRQALLSAHQSWRTLWLDGQIVTALAEGGSQKQRVQLWADREGARFRALTGPLDGSPTALQVSDGVTQARVDLENDTSQTQAPMPGARDLSWQAPQPASGGEISISPHPLDQEIDTPLAEMAFPAAIAQQGGDFTPAAMEKIAGRLVLLVEHSDGAQLRSRLWIDTESRVILRWDQYGKAPAANSPAASLVINALVLDAEFPDDLFSLRVREKPQFALDAAGSTNPTPVPPAAEFFEGAGELYLVIDRSPEDLRLARLPGSCVTGEAPCPAPQVVEGFPNRNNTVEPLVWSPDGRLAALVQQGMLYGFDPQSGEWNALAQFPILREDVAWSAGSDRLAFVAQQADGSQDIYVVGPDGTGLQNLTGGQYAGADTFLWVEGFLADGRLLFEVMQRTTANPFVVEPREGAQPAPVQDLTMQRGILAISPDRQQVAYTTSQAGTTTLHAAALAPQGDGALRPEGTRRVATFQQAAVQQMLWVEAARGDEWIIFLVSSGGSENMVTTVYAVRPDGTDLRQLYQASSIHRLAFAERGRLILASLVDNGGVTIIPLDGGAARPLEAPGLRLDERILGVSWSDR